MKTTILILASLITLPALAGEQRSQVAYPADYKAECGSCHAPFPPGLLDQAGWARTMRDLGNHFGTDASLDDRTSTSIGHWLQQHAGTRVSTSNPPRVTTTAWFKREHREVPANAWKDARIKSPANCAACHGNADQGRFSEREISIPGFGRHYEDD